MKKINKKELHELFTKLKQNKTENIFSELYTKYRKLVYCVCFSIVKNNENSDDITQIVFSKIWSMDTSNLPKSSEASWLYSITKNETLNYLRKNRNTFELEDIYNITDEDVNINKLLDYDSYNKLISKLNKKEQEIISLKILSNLSFKEISQVLNEPVGTIKWRYYKSIHTLKILLSNFGMFLITFIIGLKAILSNSERNEAQVIDNVIKEDEDNRKESMENSSANKINQDSVSNEIIKEEITIPQENETNINYYGIGILGISGVFLITTIIFTIFFTKYQLKGKKKLSK